LFVQVSFAMKRTALVAAACFLLLEANAQISLESTATSNVRTLLSLQAGVKYIYNGALQDTVTIYNTDLSVHRHLLIAPPPLGYTWGNYLWYVTETLFDTDSTTIEFAMSATGPNPGSFHFAVLREDGTALFTKTPGTFMGGAGDGTGLNANPFIVQTNTGAKLLLQAALLQPTEIYALPGTLPCPQYCDGSLITGSGEQLAPPPGTQLSLFPNPANEGTAVIYELPQGTNTADLVFYNTTGQVILQLPVDSSTDRVQVNTSMLAAGTYLYQLRTATEVIGGPRLVVVH
jgi:Secretion system C-terminal sorting domain